MALMLDLIDQNMLILDAVIIVICVVGYIVTTILIRRIERQHARDPEYQRKQKEREEAYLKQLQQQQLDGLQEEYNDISKMYSDEPPSDPPDKLGSDGVNEKV